MASNGTAAVSPANDRASRRAAAVGGADVEILFELLVPLLHFLGELLLQLVIEVFGEIGLHGLKEPFRRPKPLHPILAGVSYSAFGAGCGLLSVWLVPSLLIDFPALRVANVVLSPLLAGLVMAAMSAWRRRRGEELIRLDRFAYGFLFALALALVRLYAAEP